MKTLNFIYGGKSYKVVVYGDFVKLYTGGLLVATLFISHFPVYDKAAGWNLNVLIRAVDYYETESLPF